MRRSGILGLVLATTLASLAAAPARAITRKADNTTRHSAETRRARAAGVVHHAEASARAHVHAAGRATSRATRREVARTGAAGRRVAVAGRAAAVKVRRFGERFTASSINNNIAEGDITAGEDPVVRAAAIEALGNLNGTALAIDPSSGRILAMVNQKLALSSGAEPCSTIKVAVALSALSEGLVKADTPVNLGGHYSLDLTHALAKSVNLYFEVLGRAMGFERVKHYANEFGLGELAGYNIAGEQLGTYPDTELPAAAGGVGRMCSFGESISMTPLQLGALVSAIANGGTLYYLQHPTTADDIASFVPRIKRTLDISRFIPDLQDGMAGAVEYGTARSLRVNFHELPVFGKTGTCSNAGTRYGWFASFSDSPMGSLVTVFFLEGGRPVFGPRAAELTGLFYRSLWDRKYFDDKTLARSQSTSNNSTGR